MDEVTEKIEALCMGELASVLYRQYQAFINRQMKEANSNSSELLYLTKIPDGGTINQKHIAEKLFCDNALVTRSLRELEKKGFVKREKSSADKRETLVSLTKEGEDAKFFGIRQRMRWKDEVMEGLDENQRKLLLPVFRCMTKKALDLVRRDGNDWEEADE